MKPVPLLYADNKHNKFTTKKVGYRVENNTHL